jgi:hypothetical protein
MKTDTTDTTDTPDVPQDDESRRVAQAKANADLKDLLQSKDTAPRGFVDGCSFAGEALLGSIVLAGGALIALPVAGGVIGGKSGGVLGGLFGGIAGVLGGVVAAPLIVVGGVADSAIKLGKGIIATPESLVAPRIGKRWCVRTGRWVLENLATEPTPPPNDDDILKPINSLSSPYKLAAERKQGAGPPKEMCYYEILGVSYDVGDKALRRNYFVAARAYHPDRNKTEEALEKFQKISEAYHVLSDPTLRARYDEHGAEGLSASASTALSSEFDPGLLFSFMFGSDCFTPIVGRLALATDALVDESKPITAEQAGALQRRRVVRLAIELAGTLDSFIDDDTTLSRDSWVATARSLADTSFGVFMLTAIGQAYQLTAVEFQGALDSGVGMPSIVAWARSKKAGMGIGSAKRNAEMEQMRSTFGILKMTMDASKMMGKASSEDERRQVEVNAEMEMLPALVNLFWMTTVVDITATLHEACEIVLFDQSQVKEKRIARANALVELGEVYQDVAKEHGAKMEISSSMAGEMFHEATLKAQLETIRRREENIHAATERSAMGGGAERD